MRSVPVAIIAECLLPEINGVTNSVLRVIEQLDRTGHHTLSWLLGEPVERLTVARPLARALGA